MLRRPWFLPALLCAPRPCPGRGRATRKWKLATAGIAPIDSSGTLEITGIHVDVGGKDAQAARYEGWRQAQRQGFKALWAKTHKRPVSEAPTRAGFDARRAGQLDRRRARADRPQPLYRRPRHPVRPVALGRAARGRRRCPAFGADAPDPGADQRRAPTRPSSCAIPGSAPGRSSGRRRARSTMSASAGRGSTRCWSMRPRSTALAAAGGATSSISTAPRTSWSRRSSSSASIPAGRRSPASSAATARQADRRRLHHLRPPAGASALQVMRAGVQRMDRSLRRACRRPAGARPEPRHPGAAASAGSGRGGSAAGAGAAHGPIRCRSSRPT